MSRAMEGGRTGKTLWLVKLRCWRTVLVEVQERKGDHARERLGLFIVARSAALYDLLMLPFSVHYGKVSALLRRARAPSPPSPCPARNAIEQPNCICKTLDKQQQQENIDMSAKPMGSIQRQQDGRRH